MLNVLAMKVFCMSNKHPHPTDDTFQKGLQRRTQVMGQDFVNKAFGGATTIWVDFPLQKAVSLPDDIRARVTP